MTSPYQNLPDTAFWRSGVCGVSPQNMLGIYQKKWEISSGQNVATAGSCFAQHISRYMRRKGFSVMDTELAPSMMSEEEQESYGYGLYSARFGNIYTVHQLLQLAKESFSVKVPENIAWEKDGRFYDALRPAIQPGGFQSQEDLYASRVRHISCVRKMFLNSDVFVFTLGLTEAWLHKASNTVFPTAPETIAGQFDPQVYEFKNFNLFEIVGAFEELMSLLKQHRGGRDSMKFLLTVSPVPLTATAAGKHILQATIYSKSVLRAVAGYLADKYENIDYFPSFEIINNPSARSGFFNDNLRTVKPSGVESVMNVFFSEHGEVLAGNKAGAEGAGADKTDDVQCEEVLLEAFSSGSVSACENKEILIFIGDSHLSGIKESIERSFANYRDNYQMVFLPSSWMVSSLMDVEGHQNFTVLEVKEEYKSLLPDLPTTAQLNSGARICFVGLGLLGDGVVRAHGALNAVDSRRVDSKINDNPVLPIISSLSEVQAIADDASRLSNLENFDAVRKVYVHNLNLRINIYNRVAMAGVYKSVHWIAAPNMVERTARYRFGDEYVESRNHFLHTRIAESYLDEYNATNRKPAWVIKHPLTSESVNGFTKDEFAFNSSVNDIHTNGRFYESALARYFKAIK